MSKLSEAARLRTEFGVQLRLLRAAGAWTPGSGGVVQAVYGCYCAFIVVSLVVFVATQVSAILHFWGDIISITNSVCVTFVYILAIFKLVILLKMRRLTDELVENLDRCMERYGRTFEREKAFVFGECARRGRWISLMQAWMGLCLYVAWEVQPMLRVQSCSTTECRSQSGFPTVVWYPFSFTEPPAYQVVFIVVSTGLFYGNIISITVHSTLCTLMIYVAGHLRVLNLMARNLCSTQQYDKTTGDHKQCNMCDAEERMREHLRECVRYHIDIERMVQQLSKLVGPILLGELLVDMITVSASAFVTTALSERLQVSVYSCDWTGGSPRFLRELRIVLSRTGRPLLLTASKFYTITRETFLLIPPRCTYVTHGGVVAMQVPPTTTTICHQQKINESVETMETSTGSSVKSIGDVT
ncbi:uncharacterized protein LOC126481780 [Schistocerca serialis cubense]|uniref:uncharacterized protein LOC126481780 n=1 Tax=Schistocerca serialis cubense TaxID=2023355 RepID=UPI00214EC826|nr:uncharacterized protein LOC126481780 [Schistocerca serialis cubense]